MSSSSDCLPPSATAYQEVDSLSDDDYDVSDEDDANSVGAKPSVTLEEALERDNQHLFISVLLTKTLNDVRDTHALVQNVILRLRDVKKRVEAIQRKEMKSRVIAPPPKKRYRSYRVSATDIKTLRKEVETLSIKLTAAGKIVETFAASAEPKMPARSEGLNEADASNEYRRLRYQFRKNMHRFLTTERDRMKVLCVKYGI